MGFTDLYDKSDLVERILKDGREEGEARGREEGEKIDREEGERIGREEGAEKMNRFYQYLINNGKDDEMRYAANNESYRKKLMKEYEGLY